MDRSPLRTVPTALSLTSKCNMCPHKTRSLTRHRAKKQVTDQGGKITNEFKLIKGFTWVHRYRSLYDTPLIFCSAEFPADKVHTLKSNEVCSMTTSQTMMNITNLTIAPKRRGGPGGRDPVVGHEQTRALFHTT